MSIIVRPESNSVITKNSATLTGDFKLIVESGCKAELVLNGERHLVSSGEYGVASVLNLFRNVKKTLLGRVAPDQRLIVYGSKSEFSDSWGIYGIPYRDSEGMDIQVGCNGDIRFDVISPEKVYNWVIQKIDGNDMDAVDSDSVWETIHQEMDQIIKKYIAQYYRESNRRDGMDFEPYRVQIADELSRKFETGGIHVTRIFVNNLSNPVLPQITENTVKEEVTQENRQEVANATGEKKICFRCAMVNEPSVRYCVRCGEALN